MGCAGGAGIPCGSASSPIPSPNTSQSPVLPSLFCPSRVSSGSRSLAQGHCHLICHLLVQLAVGRTLLQREPGHGGCCLLIVALAFPWPLQTVLCVLNTWGCVVWHHREHRDTSGRCHLCWVSIIDLLYTHICWVSQTLCIHVPTREVSCVYLYIYYEVEVFLVF